MFFLLIGEVRVWRLLVVVGLAGLLSGCGLAHRLPLHAEYQRIELGERVPPEIDCDAHTPKSLYSDWGWATGAKECYGIVTDEAERVVAKKYQVSGEEGSLLLLWYRGRYWTEWSVLLPKDIDPHDASAVLPILRERCAQLDSIGKGQSSDELLDLAAEEGDWGDARICLKKTIRKKAFPANKRTLWRVERPREDAVRILNEDRVDVSLVVWALRGYSAMTKGRFP